MIRIYLFVCFFVTTLLSFGQTRTVAETPKFQAGEIPIFMDSLIGETPGEFPSHWNLVGSGLVEIMEMDGLPVMGFVQKSTITPLMETEAYLPAHFTIEFDAYFHNQGNEAYYLKFDNKNVDVRFSLAGISHSGNLNRTETPRTEGWKHLNLSFNKRALKAFIDGEQLLNVPNITVPPTRFNMFVLSSNSRSDKYAVIKNIRVMEGGLPLYERITSTAGFSTNQIQFASGSATLEQSSWPTIQEVAKVLLVHPDLNIIIEGHTDSDGSTETNQTLGLNRAKSVATALIAQGVNVDQLTTKSFGESVPIVENTSEEGKYLNRRVVFKIRN